MLFIFISFSYEFSYVFISLFAPVALHCFQYPMMVDCLSVKLTNYLIFRFLKAHLFERLLILNPLKLIVYHVLSKRCKNKPKILTKHIKIFCNLQKLIRHKHYYLFTTFEHIDKGKTIFYRLLRITHVSLTYEIILVSTSSISYAICIC